MRFSIIVAYYQPITPDYEFVRFIQPMMDQTFKDFQIVIVHDGPLFRPVPGNFPVYRPQKKYEHGCDLKEQGLRRSCGQFIFNTNRDNVYYRDTLQRFDNQIKKQSNRENMLWVGSAKMMGMNCVNSMLFYDDPRDHGKFHILTGDPPRLGNIDLLQGCVSRKLWMKYGWFSKIPQSDGVIYEFFRKRYGYRHIGGPVIGEHY